jgi:predicted MPP superfamily phosphohydrolase
MWHVGLGCTASTVAGTLGYEYALRIEPHWLSVERVEIPIKGFAPPGGVFRIVCLSDLHLRERQTVDWIREVVQQANELTPDLVCLLGDFVLDGAETVLRLAPVLAELRATHGVLSVLGNHDLWTDRDVVTAGLETAGLRVLVNEGVLLELGEQRFFVAGLDDGWSGKPDLAVALRGSPADAAIVLLMHEPDFADDLSRDGRVALQLSGHSHGGQVRLPGFGAPVLPEFGRKYDQGLYRVNGMWLYTTRGIGSLDPPLRFNCRPELSEIRLVG